MCDCGNCTCSNSVTYSRGEKGDSGATGATGPSGATGGQIETTIVANTGTVALTEGQTGSKVIFDRASGSIVTLPNTPADGTNYIFETKTDLTSNNYVINTGGLGLDAFNGFVWAKKGGAADEIFNTATGTAITMNGTTTGGDRGTQIKTSYSSSENIWYVSGYTSGSGALITPFS